MIQLYPRDCVSADWPSAAGQMEHRPITVVVKNGHIIHALLYPDRKVGLAKPVAAYRTGEYHTLVGDSGEPTEVEWLK